MRGWPRSLFGRLLAIAGVSTLAALLFAGLSIGHVLERVVMRGLDERLDAQTAAVARAVRDDGTLDPARVVDLPAFDTPGSGWSWRVDAPGGRHWQSSTDAPDRPPPPPPPPPPGEAHRPHDRPPPPGDRRPGDDGPARSGGRLHYRQLTIATAQGPVIVTASGPRAVVAAPLREAMMPLLLSLGLLGVGLAAATLVQLRLGLRPLRDLREALAEVVAGTRRHVPLDQPAELLPLAEELNLLIDQNEAGLAHARRHVANLAHGLKTPLAALGLTLAESGRDPDGRLAAMLEEIDRRVRHHLRRARAVAGGGTRARTLLAPAIDDLVAVLRRIHADKTLAIETRVGVDLVVALDPQDLDEMLGNLLDNACRHAHATIRITAHADGAAICIAIADDGPGLDPALLAEALVPGRRLDERGDGHGFGLSITEELADLNGGSLTLARAADLGGLLAQLRLPTAGADARSAG